MRAARVDSNQAEIVAALKAVGATVQHLHKVGAGCPDICAGYQCVNYLLEIKRDNGKVNKLQKEWHANWRGSVFVIRTVDEALDAIGLRNEPT